MELASIDIVTDGEVRRELSNRFANALEGIDLDNPGVALDRTGHENPVPRAVGEIHRTRPVEVRDAEFLRRNTNREIKVTLPGPFTMTQQAQNEHYPDEEQPRFCIRRRRQRGGARPEAGRRRRHPDRRALSASSARTSPSLRDQGDRQGACRDRRGNRVAHLLRLRPIVKDKPPA